MKPKALTAMTVVALLAGAAVAQPMSPPVTMQPIPNPPETGHKPMHGPKHHPAPKHHAPAKPAADAAPK